MLRFHSEGPFRSCKHLLLSDLKKIPNAQFSLLKIVIAFKSCKHVLTMRLGSYAPADAGLGPGTLMSGALSHTVLERRPLKNRLTYWDDGLFEFSKLKTAL